MRIWPSALCQAGTDITYINTYEHYPMCDCRSGETSSGQSALGKQASSTATLHYKAKCKWDQRRSFSSEADSDQAQLGLVSLVFREVFGLGFRPGQGLVKAHQGREQMVRTLQQVMMSMRTLRFETRLFGSTFPYAVWAFM